ncbi:MAG: ATP-binding protein [Leptolyngbyaceae cyanobacterium]
MKKSRLLLLLGNSENRRLLVDRLTPKFEIVLSLPEDAFSEAVTESAPDLVIFDLVELGNWHVELSTWRQTAKPLFLPVLVLMPQNTIGTLPFDVRYQIDELVTIPIDPEELDVRIAILLRTRDLSREVALQNQRLEEMNTLKSRFVSVVSHEFRNPLSTISGMAQVLQARGQSLTPEKKQLLFERIQSAVSKLITLLDDLLVLNRNASSQVTFKPEIVDLEGRCQRLLVDFEASANSTRKIRFQAQGDCSRVYVDAALIDTILGNLLSNALKYSPIDCPVSLSLTCQQNQCIFEVSDEGRGIPLEDQPALFDSFFRARNVGATPGTGLGLSIVKQCVDLHRGTIAVQSQVDEGTTFTVTLPTKMDSELLAGNTICREHN